MTVRPIQSYEFPSNWRTILLLLGEKAGLREGVTPNYSRAGRFSSKKKETSPLRAARTHTKDGAHGLSRRNPMKAEASRPTYV